MRFSFKMRFFDFDCQDITFPEVDLGEGKDAFNLLYSKLFGEQGYLNQMKSDDFLKTKKGKFDIVYSFDDIPCIACYGSDLEIGGTECLHGTTVVCKDILAKGFVKLKLPDDLRAQYPELNGGEVPELYLLSAKKIMLCTDQYDALPVPESHKRYMKNLGSVIAYSMKQAPVPNPGAAIGGYDSE